MPICPFIQGDLQTGNIKFMVYNSNMDKSLIEIIQEWNESDFKTGLILHIGDDMKTKVKVSKIIKKMKLKIDKDYDVKALDSKGKMQKFMILPKHRNDFLDALIQNNIKVRG